MKKILIAAFIVAGFFGASVAYSQSSWIGTAHIAAGDVIRSAPLLSNLNYLFNEKVHKPPVDCNTVNKRLGWVDGEWTCEDWIENRDETFASCILNGTIIEDGSSIAGYTTQSVPFGEQCVSEVRSCSNGELSGSYQFTSCVEDAPDECTFGGQTYQSGQRVTAFQSASVPFGEQCVSEVRSCSNGELSGSYAFSSCAAEEPASCTFNGATVAHGATVEAFELGSVAAPNSCRPEVRTCSDGVLSGSFQSESCSVEATACSIQDLTFSYTTTLYGAGIDESGNDCVVNPSPFSPGYTGTCRPISAGSTISGSCVIPASLVREGQTGQVQTFESAQCQNAQPTTAPQAFVARCGLSGWELSDIEFETCNPNDEGNVVEVINFTSPAVVFQVDERCSCGVSAVGGAYGRNVTCVGTGPGLGF